MSMAVNLFLAAIFFRCALRRAIFFRCRLSIDDWNDVCVLLLFVFTYRTSIDDASRRKW